MAADTSEIVVEVQAGGEKFVEEVPISIRPSAPLLKANVSGVVNGGSTVKPSLPSTVFLPRTEKYALVLSRNPAAEIAEQLRYVVQYPYGCTEQVVSSAFPQLYYGDLAQQFGQPGVKTGNANQHVMEAIRKIRLRQLYNGAMMLWDNEGTEHWWTTIYTAHFLLEAKKAGFAVEESLLGTMLNYINNRLRNRQTIIYHYNRNQQKKIAPKEVAYSLYVLALASRANISAMNYYKANPAMLSLDSRYLLGVAYAVAGDRKKFAEVLPNSFSGEVSVPETGGSFYSPIRDEAIALNALLDVDPDNAQVPVMARHIVSQLKNRSWYSTQESAFSFLALGKLARSAGASNTTAEIRHNGKVVARFTGKEITYVTKGNATNIEIVTKGEGKVFYYLQGEGISATGEYRQEDSYLKVRRQFFDRNGRLHTTHDFKVNDLIIVQVSIERLFDSDVENVVITDMLPAGFEIENPRTREIPGMDWIKDAATPLQLDVRDDRINLFVDINQNRQVYYYAVRAVSPGVYHVGPVAADAMYNGEYHSYHGATTVKINE